MISVATNVLVRLLAQDDPAQSARARKLFESEEVFVAKTVLLETEWVLRSSYSIAAPRIDDAFRRLLGMRNVAVEDRNAVLRALDLYSARIDFADALHLASSAALAEFATFDSTLRRRAARLNAQPPVRSP